jgi:GTPase SAR1 family protein
MTSTFFRGAVACLLFYDISVSESFKDLRYWLEQVRLFAGPVPIFLVAIKSNLKDKIDLAKLSDFVEINEISRFYLISVREEFRTSQIFENIVSRIFEHIVYYRPENIKLTDQEKSLYNKFLVAFSKCPICSTKNHLSNLNRIFFSQDSNLSEMRRNLINLIQSSEYFDEMPLEKVKMGILCCSCYKKVFS